MNAASGSGWGVLGLLRFLLALHVAVFHLGIWFMPAGTPWVETVRALDGKSAVVGFLLVSGYSIQASLAAREDGFLTRRFLRVYPLYFVAVALTAGVELWQGGVVVAPGTRFESLGPLALVGNALLLQMYLVKPLGFNLPLWSLSIEMSYYVMARWFRDHPRTSAVLVVLSMAAFLMPRRPEWGLLYVAVSKFYPLSFLWPWVIGFFLGQRRSAWPLLALAAGALCVVLSPFHTEGALAVVVYGVAVAGVLWGPGTRLPLPVDRVFNLLGDVSYPLYLFHVPVFIVLWCTGHVPGAMLYLAAALAAASAGYVAIDRVVKPRWLNARVTAVAGRLSTWRLARGR